MERRRAGLGELDFAYGVVHHKDHCRQLIASNGFTTVCEIGGGRSPLFGRDEALAMGLDYTILDISDTELRAAPDHVKKIQAEHVRDATAMHRNVLHMLRPGGLAFHYFPTLYTPAFVANRLLPEDAARRVLFFIFPWRRHDHLAKFPARYAKCFGPTRRMKRYFERLGYRVEEYRPFYGTDYLVKMPLLGFIDSLFTRLVARRRMALFSSYVWLVLRKPAIEENGGAQGR